MKPSKVEKGIAGTHVVWSAAMTKKLGQLRGNQYEINGLLSEFLIEISENLAEVVEQKDREISAFSNELTLILARFAKLEAENKSLQNRIADLEAMK